MLNFRSVSDLDQLIRSNLSKIPKVDCIVGIPRSGMLPATLLALYLGKPLLSIEQMSHMVTNKYSSRVLLGTSIRNILIVDDSCNNGNTLRKVRSSLALIDSIVSQFNIKYCAIYVSEKGKNFVDFYLEQIEQPRVFEWNILDHDILVNSCVDLDGVLCENPTGKENDDSENYRQFISCAKPKFIPQHRIKAIVTCRLEKYRELTEAWLKAHKINYGELYMMNIETAEERRRLNCYAEFKAKVLEKVKATLFIESDSKQAQQISLFSNKPVYCVDTNTFYGGK